jgi:hypothetical protein
MKIFIKLYGIKASDNIFYLLNCMKIGEIYNSGEKRYMRIPKGHAGKKFIELL